MASFYSSISHGKDILWLVLFFYSVVCSRVSFAATIRLLSCYLYRSGGSCGNNLPRDTFVLEIVIYEVIN